LAWAWALALACAFVIERRDGLQLGQGQARVGVRFSIWGALILFIGLGWHLVLGAFYFLNACFCFRPFAFCLLPFAFCLFAFKNMPWCKSNAGQDFLKHRVRKFDRV
jgi:hypothetical protein